MITLVIAVLPSLIHATDLDRRSLLRGVGGLVAAPRLATSPSLARPIAAPVPAAPVPLKLNWLTFPSNVEEMARCWRWANAEKSFFREFYNFDFVMLVRHLRNDSNAPIEVRAALDEYLALVHPTVAVNAFSREQCNLKSADGAARALVRLSEAAGTRVDESLRVRIVEEVLALEDRVMAEFGLTAEDYFKSVALFKEPYRVFFTKDPADARRLRLDEALVKAIFEGMYEISPALVNDLARHSPLQSLRDGLFQAINVTKRNSLVLRFDFRTAPTEVPWYQLGEGESLEDRADEYVSALKRLADQRALVDGLNAPAIRTHALKIIDGVERDLREELRTLPARLDRARAWVAENPNPGDRVPSGFRPTATDGFDPTWLLKVHSLANAANIDLGPTVESAALETEPARLAACDQALLAAPTTALDPLQPRENEPVSVESGTDEFRK